MTSDLIVFIILALVAVSAALGMLFSKNAVYSALFLVLNFVTVAVFYLLLGAPFIAMAQITVYAGAIMVLFLFVIMLLGAEQIRGEFNLRDILFPSSLAVILAIQALYLILSRAQSAALIAAPDASLNSTESLREMALMLFNQYLLPFEAASILLLVAMVGVIVLARQEKAG